MKHKYVYRYSERSKSDTSFTICTSANEKEVQFPEKFSPRITDAFQNGNFQIATCFVASSSFTRSAVHWLKKGTVRKEKAKKNTEHLDWSILLQRRKTQRTRKCEEKTNGNTCMRLRWLGIEFSLNDHRDHCRLFIETWKQHSLFLAKSSTHNSLSL